MYLLIAEPQIPLTSLNVLLHLIYFASLKTDIPYRTYKAPHRCRTMVALTLNA